MRRSRESFEAQSERISPSGALAPSPPSPPSGISLLENPYEASHSVESIPELSPVALHSEDEEVATTPIMPHNPDFFDSSGIFMDSSRSNFSHADNSNPTVGATPTNVGPRTPTTQNGDSQLLDALGQPTIPESPLNQQGDPSGSGNLALSAKASPVMDMRDVTMMDGPDVEMDDDDDDDDERSLMSDMDRDDSDSEDDAVAEQIARDAIEFHVDRASVTRSGVIPCCVFVGRVTWGDIGWEIYFGQKQILRLHISLFFYLAFQKRRLLSSAVRLPWTIWREKRAEKRVHDALTVQNYIRALLADDDLRNSDPLLSFLEVSPSRAMSRYGPSLKEGYVHMRMNGAFQLPLYTCVNRTIEALYRHLYRTWMRIAFISAVVTFILPIGLLIVTTLPRFLSGKKTLVTGNGDDVQHKTDVSQIFFGIAAICVLLFIAVFVYKFFDHRLGVIRRWVVLKPNCFAAYRRRSDKEPSEVFLFDKTFTARKGSYRQGVSWMPSGFVLGSRSGFIEIDTGHYYTRLTMSISLALVCWVLLTISGRIYDFESMPFRDHGVPLTQTPSYKNWTLAVNATPGPDGDAALSQLYCGYYFRTPVNETVHVSTDVRGAVITKLPEGSNSSTISAIQYFLGGDDVGFSIGLLSNNLPAGSLVAVSKRIDVKEDRFLPTDYNISAKRVGRTQLHALVSETLVRFNATSDLCIIPIKIAPFNFEAVGYYILMLLVGGMVSATFGLALNYLISYFGLWHAHVRRDHWYRCVKRLQKVKRQDTEHRYRSFAPQHVSTLPAFECSITSNQSTAAPLSVRTKATSEGSIDSTSSFVAQPPPPCAVAWHVDGEDTYEAMYKAISEAKYEILIAGWWVTPDLYLLRPGRKLPPHSDDNAKKTNETQLRNLLLLKAEQGVKINVLIYREVKLALTLNSAYTKRSLMLHPNIRVLRDPIFQIQSLGFWSHHEKIVCIDQSLAFAGGLDLCFGRYDHSGHPLSDPGGANIEDQMWPGKDYSNPIIKDFIRVNKPFEDLIDRASQPRMPWHDVHCSISGPAVQDIAYHFIQRWNFVCSKNDYQLRTGWCICFRSRRFKLLPKCLLPMDFNGWTLRYPSSGKNPKGEPVMKVPLAREDSAQIDVLDEPFPFRVMRMAQPRGATRARWGDDVNDTVVHSSPGSGGSTSELSNEHHKHNPSKHTLRDQRCRSMVQVLHPNSNICSIQVCRSVSMWSAGVPTETSIHEAYIDIIAKAQHYVYIENQFFVSGLHSNGVVSNRILQALVHRIQRAVENNEVFRVYVVMPLLPAFEGNIRSEELTNLHAVMHWQFSSISRGGHSLFEALRKFTDRPDSYVSFYGLRKYGILPNGCVSTEQIYIHSKLMIADDKYAIIGSANINDRSMMGDRDSEIALVIEDVQFEEGMMNERPYRRGVVAGALRMQLFREHLGLAEDDASSQDPTAEWSWLRIKNISAKNTAIFESVFDCAPSNRMTSFSSFKSFEMTQIFENQRINVNVLKKGHGRHIWDSGNLKEGDYAPWTDVNGVPVNMDKVNLDDFVMDRFKDKKRKHLFLMDHDGWCYARNFSVFQEVRMQNFRKRDKIQHFMTDRLMAQVRRRRWVRKDSGLLPAAEMVRNSSFSESDDDDNSRWVSLWRRLRSDSTATLSRANSFNNTGRAGNSLASSMVYAGENSYPNSPAFSSFRRGPPSSPHARSEQDQGRDSNAWLHGGVARSSTIGASTNVHMPHHHATRDSEGGGIRASVDSTKGGIGLSLKKWASFMDTPLDLGRRSRFTEEYFAKDKDEEVYGQTYTHDDHLMESGRPSTRSVQSVDANTPPRLSVGAGARSIDLGDGECQIGHLQTAATVRKEDESRARGQLSEIRGHLVEFPIDFLKEEILQPSILPRDLHI
jgi:phospholipase D1/2